MKGCFLLLVLKVSPLGSRLIQVLPDLESPSLRRLSSFPSQDFWAQVSWWAHKTAFVPEHMTIPWKILWQPWDRQAAGAASQTKSRTAKLGSRAQFAERFVLFNQSWKEITISPTYPQVGSETCSSANSLPPQDYWQLFCLFTEGQGLPRLSPCMFSS